MNQPQYEQFSQLWERIAKKLGLDSSDQPPPPRKDNVRPIKPSGGGKRFRRWLIGAALLFLIFVLTPWIVYLATEWLWFGEVGFRSVFAKILITRVGLGLATAVFFFIVVYGNVLIARRMAPRYQFGRGAEIIERVPFPDKLVRRMIPVLLLAPSIIAFTAGAANWDDFLKFLNATEFGVADPIFSRDAGFYVFTLPFLRFLQSLVWWTLIFTLLATAAVHFLDYAISVTEGKVTLAPHVKGHLSVLLGFIMFTLGAGYLLKGYLLLYSARGVVFGASYTDVHAQLPVFRFLAATALVAGVLAVVNIHFRGWKLPAAAIGLIILTAIFAGQAYPFVVQQYQVSPNELATEEPYIKYNIEFTRTAFDLNSIEDRSFSASDNLTGQNVQNNINTIGNVRLWDPRTLGDTYRQIQTIRPYYSFQDVDVDRYTFGGRMQQVMSSPREIALEGLDPRARTWQNEHLVYTHGYGMVMSPVAQVTAAGLPELAVKDIPPQTGIPELEIENPAIYFGEQANSYVLVKSGIEEFDYPQGDENVYVDYTGSGGINVSGYLSRLAFSLRFGDVKLLLSDAVSDDTSIIIHREIKERIATIAPFLQFDDDPYAVQADGRIFWIQDAYTTTSDFPYSQPAPGGVNYIRNSVKVIVDAYNGSVKFYVVDDADPMIRTYMKIFPDLFTPGEEISEELRAHLRYPEDMFQIQAGMYTTYHMTDPRVFYNKEDQWNIPRQQVGSGTAPMEPYYVVMTLPGEEREEFVLMQPFTPGTRDNMIAWMAAKSDPANYGERLVFKFPKDKLVFGPTQVQSRFNQDPNISAQITLWSQSGSQVLFGNLLVIPIEESLLYVQPLYLRAERSQIPEFKRVMVSYGGRVLMESDLVTALEKLFSTSLTGIVERPPEASEGSVVEVPGQPSAPAGPEVPAAPGGDLNTLAATAQDHYNRAVDAQRRGDWATYGSELKALEETLRQMQTASSSAAPAAE